ncbi:MAG: fumarylacetoacetate hydrolase family protein [Pseudomonadota bacterium]|nr:fumarylacetoacetate hydrolase family protein [Pseudomonadota bacterium]
MIRVYATAQGMVLEQAGTFRQLPAAAGFDELFRADDPAAWLNERLASAPAVAEPAESALLAPIQSQEVWAAGVTYLRSMTARMEEAREAGGGNFYDRVYNAARPELFFKATPQRVIGPGGKVRIRSDSKWNVPEPELTLAINSAGRIFGFSVGNDMSSRDIEGENPLYLPQAKTYAGSAGLGPCLVVTEQLPSADTAIVMTILRGGAAVFSGETHVGRIKRPLPSLAEYLFRDNNFPSGAWLMTGTGIVPPDAFTLDHGDEIRITIEPAGTLRNTVA